MRYLRWRLAVIAVLLLVGAIAIASSQMSKKPGQTTAEANEGEGDGDGDTDSQPKRGVNTIPGASVEPNQLNASNYGDIQPVSDTQVVDSTAGSNAPGGNTYNNHPYDSYAQPATSQLSDNTGSAAGNYGNPNYNPYPPTDTGVDPNQPSQGYDVSANNANAGNDGYDPTANYNAGGQYDPSANYDTGANYDPTAGYGAADAGTDQSQPPGYQVGDSPSAAPAGDYPAQGYSAQLGDGALNGEGSNGATSVTTQVQVMQSQSANQQGYQPGTAAALTADQLSDMPGTTGQTYGGPAALNVSANDPSLSPGVQNEPGAASVIGSGTGGAQPPATAAFDTSTSTLISAGQPGGQPGAGNLIGSMPTSSEAQPGARHLEGAQSPSITIEKFAPGEVQVGQSVDFQIRVRNVGQVPARRVTVSDRIPRGTEFQQATPQPQQTADGSLLWTFDSLDPGQQETIRLTVVPVTEGEIGSVAAVTFEAQASVRTRSTKPELRLEQTGPQEVLVGEEAVFSIAISNQGSGAANNVVLWEDVPDGLSHGQGSQLKRQVGTLQPGERREFQLRLKAERAGLVNNIVQLSADGNDSLSDADQLTIIAPELVVQIGGPTRRFLERQATYSIVVANPGTADARNVTLNVKLPAGLRFAEATDGGQYDNRTREVTWYVDVLPKQKKGEVRLSVLPIETGNQTLIVGGRANLGLTTSQEHVVAVESLSELQFTVSDVADPIEPGAETTYLIEIENNGQRRDENVRLAVALPPGMQYIDSSGPTQAQPQQSSQGTILAFAPIAELPGRQKATYKIKVKGREAGDHILRAQLQSDALQQRPVTKEESTHIYNDN